MDARDIIWVTSAIGIAAAYVLWHTHRNKRIAVDIVDLEFDRHSRRLELTVENRDERPKSVKSALRLVRYGNPDGEFFSEGVPMMTGRVQSTNVAGFDLLAADDHPTLVRGKTREHFVYVVPENITFKSFDNVRVDLSSDDGHVSTVVKVRPREDVADLAARVDGDIERIIDEVDRRIDGIEESRRSDVDEIRKFKLLWEEEILKDIEEELVSERERVDDSINRLMGFTYGAGLSLGSVR
jgi:hypothetical protein